MLLAELHYLNIAIVLGFILGVALLALALLPLFRLIARKLCGWDALVQHFPPAPVRKTGESYKVSGYIGGAQGNLKQYLIEPAAEGLLITATFARNSPILIPWSAISEVSCVDIGFLGSDVAVRVEYEKPLGFNLPKAALQVIQQHVPAERINTAGLSGASPAAAAETLADLIKNRRQ